MSSHQDSLEALLMQRLAEGHDLALNELMDQWNSRIISYLTRLTGDHHAALDLAQETFVRVYRHRSAYRSDQAFSTWLFHIATNLARNHSRWRSRHPEVLLGSAEEGEHPLKVDTDTPADAAIRQEQARAVHQAVIHLPEDLREALILSAYECLPHAEIGEVLGMSPKAVEMRIYRARQILRERLTDFLSGDREKAQKP